MKNSGHLVSCRWEEGSLYHWVSLLPSKQEYTSWGWFPLEISPEVKAGVTSYPFVLENLEILQVIPLEFIK